MIKSIMCCCGNGLGSSFILEMNIKKALKDLNVEGVSVGHTSISDLSEGMADLIICAQDLVHECERGGNVVGLENLMSIEEIKQKLKEYI